ncbi:hypothetical protein V9T40_012761 [Parthenolecanium corni]|uniref:Enoyl-CoA delta isomerase 2, mitochondrial n=1 Tax=Parthenolecanium corni TaxID=536013 RepID=A0AAN9TA55_9HEMI
MTHPGLLVDIKDGIMTITFNQPRKKNPIGVGIMAEFRKILDEAASNDSVDFVVLTGSGDYYSSGMDMSPPTEPLNTGNHITVGREFVGSFIDFPKLLIAIVNGPAVGIAVTTLALCDLVYCSSEATFVVPFCLHGLSAEGCSSYLFPRIMGSSRANEILQFGKKFTAAEAKEWGFVTDVYKPEELKSVLLPKLQKMKNTLVQASIRVNKKLIRQCDSKLLHEVNAAEWEELETRSSSPEFISALMRFAERKRAGNKL